MLKLDFKSFEIKDLPMDGDFQKKLIFFCEQWFSQDETLDVQTSGSTGSPKKMNVEKKKMRHSANMTCRFLHLSSEDTALLALPIEYISGKMMTVRAMEQKMKLLVAEPSLNPLQKLEQKVDFCALTPLQVEHSLSQLKWIKKLIIGGAAVSESLKNKIKAVLDLDLDQHWVYETYGMTETLSHIALKQIYPENQAYFQVLDGVAIGVDARGCLTINSPQLHDGILQTNDVVEILDEKRFKFLGRADFVINSGGAKIHPEQIEKKIKTNLDAEVVAVGLADVVLGQKLVLVVEDNGFSEVEKQELTQQILALDYEKSFHKPKEIKFCPKLPRTENGKISRWQLLTYLEN